jgi:hypothetical protein
MDDVNVLVLLSVLIFIYVNGNPNNQFVIKFKTFLKKCYNAFNEMVHSY